MTEVEHTEAPALNDGWISESGPGEDGVTFMYPLGDWTPSTRQASRPANLILNRGLGEYVCLCSEQRVIDGTRVNCFVAETKLPVHPELVPALNEASTCLEAIRLLVRPQSC